MKKKTPDQELEILRRDIREEVASWEYINQNGCNDPFWPDGANMNLTRNHIIYDKRQISEICEKTGIPIPEEMYIPIPPEVDDYYMASRKQKERIKRIGNAEKITTKKVRYDRQQLSIF